VDDYDRSTHDDDRRHRDEVKGSFLLPLGVSAQAVATALLVVVVGAILFILFMPDSDEPPGLATATPGAAAEGAGAGTPVAMKTEGTGADAVTSGKDESGGGGEAQGESAKSTADASGAAKPTLASGAAGEAATGGTPAASGASSSSSSASSAVTGTLNAGPLAAGVYVRVTDTGPDGLRYRYGPGLDYVTIRIVPDGEIMRVSSGPEEADGIVWWRVGDQLGNFGWAAEQFLVPAPAPAVWSPPLASPTFEAGAGGGAADAP